MLAVMALALYNLYIFPHSLPCDALTYGEFLDQGVLNDWWSALYLLEARAIMKLFSPLGFMLAGKTMVALHTSIAIILAMWSNYAIAKRLSHIHPLYLWYLVPAHTIILLMIVLPYQSNLDFPGLAYLMSAVAVASGMDTADRKKSVFLFVIVILCTLQAVAFRKPLLILAPCVICYTLLQAFGGHWLKKLIVATLISLLLYITPKLIFPAFTGYTEAYPAEPMLRSDVYTACLLRNDFSVIENLEKNMPSDPVRDYHIGAMCSRGRLQNQQQWQLLKNAWLEMWQKHPDAMLHARWIQLVQFLSGGDAPDCLVHYYNRKYPWTPKIGQTYHRFNWLMYQHRYELGLAMVIQVGTWGLVMSIITFSCMGLARALVHYSHLTFFHKIILLYALLSIGGLLCYCSVVIPTGDLRFKYVPLYFSLCGIGLMVVERIIRKRALRTANSE